MTFKRLKITNSHLYGASLSLIIAGFVFLSFAGFGYLQNYTFQNEKEASAQGITPPNPSNPPDQTPTNGNGIPVIPSLPQPGSSQSNSSQASSISNSQAITPVNQTQAVTTTVRTGAENDFAIFLGLIILVGIGVYYYGLSETKSVLKTTEKKIKPRRH